MSGLLGAVTLTTSWIYVERNLPHVELAGRHRLLLLLMLLDDCMIENDLRSPVVQFAPVGRLLGDFGDPLSSSERNRVRTRADDDGMK